MSRKIWLQICLEAQIFFGTTNNFLTVFKAYSIEGKSLKILWTRTKTGGRESNSYYFVKRTGCVCQIASVIKTVIEHRCQLQLVIKGCFLYRWWWATETLLRTSNSCYDWVTQAWTSASPPRLREHHGQEAERIEEWVDSWVAIFSELKHCIPEGGSLRLRNF